MGAGISGGGLPGAHETGGTPRWGGRALHSHALVLAPPAVISMPKILKYSIKNHTKFAGHLELFYFWDIVAWYVTPPLVQLVFVLVLYSLQIFAA